MGLAVGIDFGTSNSCMAVDGAKIVPNSEGELTTPSVVAYRDKEIIVGSLAKRQALTNERQTISSIKRLLGRTRAELAEEAERLPFEIVGDEDGAVRLKIGEQELAPEQVAAMILAKIKADIELFSGEEIERAVIAVPAYFDEAQRQAIRDAATIAGLFEVKLVNEPTAAALVYAHEGGWTDKRRVIALDLGGGTFDVSLLDCDGDEFRVLATTGDSLLGGDDFDHAIVDWLAEECLRQHGIDPRSQPAALQRLAESAERAKIELSALPVTEISLPFLAVDSEGPKHLSVKLSQAQLETLTAGLLERLRKPIEDCLAAAAISPEEIDDVILVGGMTRMPAVRRAAAEITGHEPHSGVNPDHAVALGAAVRARSLAEDGPTLTLHDVTQLSLGVELATGGMEVLIAANSQLPALVNEEFTTSSDDQTDVEIHVLQGEHLHAGSNRSLGRILLRGILPAAKGEAKIEVGFELDDEGILHVSALDKTTGRGQRKSFEPTANLSAEEIERMRAEAVAALEAIRRERLLAMVRNDLDRATADLRSLLGREALDDEQRERLRQAFSELENMLIVEDDLTKIDLQRALVLSLIAQAKERASDEDPSPPRDDD